MVGTSADVARRRRPTVLEPSVLERCVGDADALHAAWGVHPLIDDAGPMRRDRFSDIFGVDAIDALIANSARSPTMRMVRDGVVLRPDDYCTTVRLGGRHVDDVIDAGKVSTQLEGGATLVVQSLHRTTPAVASFVRDLQHEISHPLQVNAYLTPPAATGLAPHRDRHDVVILQLHGTKQWTVEGLGEIELRPGDSMYIPADTEHAASTTHSTSLHLTIGVIPVTYRDVVRRALATCADLDQPLPIGYRSAEPSALVAGVECAFVAAIEHLSGLDGLSTAESEQRRRRRTPEAPGRLAALVASENITLADRIRWMGCPPSFETCDDVGRVTVDAGRRTLTVPSSVVDALRLLGAGSPIAVDRLPGLDEPSRLVLARRLVIESVCEVVRGEYRDHS